MSFVLGGAATWQAAITAASARKQFRAYVLLTKNSISILFTADLLRHSQSKILENPPPIRFDILARIELLPFPVTDSSLFDAFPVDIKAGIWEEQIATLPHMSFWGRTVRAYDDSDQAMIPLRRRVGAGTFLGKSSTRTSSEKREILGSAIRFDPTNT